MIDGGVAVLIGVPETGARIDFAMDRFFRRRGVLKASNYGDCLPSRDFPMLVDWYKKGELLLDQLVSRKIKLEETDEGFHAMERGETLRSVIVF